MKIMISQPMSGKTEQQIRKERKDLANKLMDEGYEVIDTIFNFEDVKANKFVYYLAKSIEAMSIADCIIFMKGWEKARGCIIEHDIAQKYEIPIMYDNISN